MAKMTRRNFLATGVAATAGAVTPRGVSAPAGGRADGNPPNVLLIMSDQHTRNALGASGNSVVRTPNLDALARSAVRLDNAYCTYPVCVCSRASLLSGLYTHNHRAYNNSTPWPFEVKTLGHYFGRVGYMTGMIGKMHFVDAQTHGFDYKLDFNDWHQYLGPKSQRVAEEIVDPNSGSGLPQIDDLWRDSGDPWTGLIPQDGRQGYTSIGRISALAEEDHFENFVARESIRFLRNHGKKQPFFLISSFLKPHDPVTPPERFAKMFHAPDMKLPDTWGMVKMDTIPASVQRQVKYCWWAPELRYPEMGKVHMALYYSCLAHMDDNVGKLLRALTDLGLDENTIVLYTSDHGEMLGEHGLWGKMFFYEGSVGVPLIFRVPGITPPNAQCLAPVSLVQLAPTLLELCGLNIPVGLDGTSMARLLHQPNAPAEGTVFAEMSLKTHQPAFMIRQNNLKYSYYMDDLDELYDLRSDPAEMKNLSQLLEFREKRDELKRQLFAWQKPEAQIA